MNAKDYRTIDDSTREFIQEASFVLIIHRLIINTLTERHYGDEVDLSDSGRMWDIYIVMNISLSIMSYVEYYISKNW